MNEVTIFRKIDQLNVWRRGGQRAVHKPLLLLIALAKCQQSKPRLIPFEEIEKQLTQLLVEFGPHRRVHHPEFPFMRLQNDQIWEIASDVPLVGKHDRFDVSRSVLKNNNAAGGFLVEIFNELRKKPALLKRIAQSIVQEHFTESIQDDLLCAIGLDVSNETVNRRKRDPRFREVVIRAYEHRCAICGFSLKLSNADLGLEAAHIKWHQAGGPDSVINGLALCVLHHKLFDRGAFTILPNYRIVVSEHVYGPSGLNSWLTRFHKYEIKYPQSSRYYPDKQFLDWHMREVFKQPYRELDQSNSTN